MSIDDMIIVLEKYLEEAGFDNVKERYLKNKSDDDIKTLYYAAINDFDK